MSGSLRISEIFYSLQGETTLSGLPTVFVRLTGCPLRCRYCDTEYAFKGGEWLSIEKILDTVAESQADFVCVTGGEPLAQKECLLLLEALCDQGYTVSLETSGAMAIDDVDNRVLRIVDIKTPASGEVDKNRIANFHQLNGNDQIKFVICDRNDYDWAIGMLDRYGLRQKSPVLFSPSEGQLEARTLAEWMLADKLRGVRFQLQLHKILWDGGAGH